MILFAGSLLPLIFLNKRTLDLSALLSGIGMGLFIDEVGKFLTQTNDYFYPGAAPIIYSFFLIILLIFAITSIALYFVYGNTVDLKVKEVRSSLLMIARLTAVLIDGDIHTQ